MNNRFVKKNQERIIEFLLSFSGFITVITTIGIIWVLVIESTHFFSEISIIDFLTDTEWRPSDSRNPHFGVLVLLSGTVLTTGIAIFFAVPVGLIIAIYLSEYSPKKLRQWLKPMLELLAAVPTVVYGYFALSVLTPFLRQFIDNMPLFNALSAGLVMGIMIIPIITSLSEDALRSVPKILREASYGLGATKFQTAFKVILPAASSGVVVSIILAVARAIGETMIVAVAAGTMPNLTLDPRDSVMTITTYMAETASGDVEFGSLRYQSIFAVGITLFLFTFLLNSISFYVKKKYQETYE